MLLFHSVASSALAHANIGNSTHVQIIYQTFLPHLLLTAMQNTAW